MVNIADNRIELIWFNPKTNTYECGPWIRYNNLTSEYGDGGFSVLYETDGIAAKIARKIVNELNAARFEDHPATRLVVA